VACPMLSYQCCEGGQGRGYPPPAVAAQVELSQAGQVTQRGGLSTWSRARGGATVSVQHHNQEKGAGQQGPAWQLRSCCSGHAVVCTPQHKPLDCQL
jgi:hypothetical protein